MGGSQPGVNRKSKEMRSKKANHKKLVPGRVLSAGDTPGLFCLSAVNPHSHPY